MKDFRDKVAAITGAGSGIGRALALNLAGRGCHLALSDINTEGLEQTVAAAKEKGVRVTSKVLDVANRDDFYAWASEVHAEHGKVNIIVNNAGVALGSTMHDVEYKDFEWIMNINFWGMVYGSKAFLPYLHESGEGHIVNVSSVFGLFSQPTQGAYNASKFAIRGFTESLRQELDMMESGVSATSVHPGGIKTNIARAAKYSGQMAKLEDLEKMGKEFEKAFTTTPEDAAAIILKAVEQKKRRVLVGKDAVVIDLMTRLFPTSYQKVVTSIFKKQMRGRLDKLGEKPEFV